MLSTVSKRLFAYVAAGLGIVALAAAAFGGFQTIRLNAAQELATTLRGQIALLTQRVQSDAQLIAVRDQLIGAQNQAVLAMQKASDADREAYKARIAAAEKLAKINNDRAAAIMAKQATTEDELARSREALSLIQEVVGDGRLNRGPTE
jgi:hypothetical protein